MLPAPLRPTPPNLRIRRAILRREFDGPTLARRVLTPTVMLPPWMIDAVKER